MPQTQSQLDATSKRRKTKRFVLLMLGVLAIVVALSLIERPPDMPLDADHRTDDKFPNEMCMKPECHPAEKLPKTHPSEHDRFSCLRCHDLGDVVPLKKIPSSAPSATTQPSQIPQQGAPALLNEDASSIDSSAN